MTRQTKHLLLYVAEGLGVLLALAAAIVFFLHWRVSHGGLALGVLKGPAAEMMEARLAPGSEVAFGALVLQRDKDADGAAGMMVMQAQDVEIVSPGGTRLVSLPALSFEVQTGDLMRGDMLPRYVRVDGAQISLHRARNGLIDLGLARGDGEPAEEGDFLNTLLGREEGLAGSLFEGAALTNSSIRFHDEMSGQTWEADGVRTEIAKSASGYRAALEAPFRVDGHVSDLAVKAEMSDRQREISLEVTGDAVRISDFLTLIAGPEAGERVDITLAGTVTSRFSYEGEVLQSTARLSATDGSVEIGGEAIPVTFFSVDTDFLPEQRTFNFRELEFEIAGNAAVAEGFVSLGAPGPDGELMPEQVRFDLALEDVVADLPGITPAPLGLSQLSIRGVHDLAGQELVFDELKAQFFDAGLSGALTVLLPQEEGQSAGVIASGRMTGSVTPAQVLRGWPLVLADGARDWMSQNVSAGRISDVVFDMDMPRGMIRVGHGIGNDMLDLSFTFDGVSAQYVPGMTPITGGHGRAVIRGNSLDLTAKGGTVGPVRLTEGRVLMSAFYPKETKAIYSATMEGRVEDMLSIVDEEPLGYISASGFSPTQFSGDGIFSIEIGRANKSYVPIEDYDFSGEGSFQALTLRDFREGRSLERGEGNVRLSKKGIEVDATAMLEDNPLSVNWYRDFGEEERTRISASGRFTPVMADRMGIPVRQFFRGEAAYRLNIAMAEAQGEVIDVMVDLDPAEVRLDALGWVKPQGVPSSLSFRLTPPDGPGSDLWLYENVRMESDGLDFAGGFTVRDNKGVQSADVTQFVLAGKADLVGNLRRGDGVTSLRVDGAYADLAPLLEGLKDIGSGAGGGLPEAVEANLTLLEARLRGQQTLRDLNASFRHDGSGLARVSLSGDFAEGGSMVLLLGDSGQDIGKEITLETDNLGALANGLLGMTSIEGGRGAYRGTFLENGPVAGTVSAGGIRLRNAPLIARLLSAGSLTGLNDLLIGEGIEFTDITADLQYGNGILTILGAKATGPSVGISAEGDVNFAAKVVDINGAFAPAYQVNSLFGNLPGVGEIFVSKAGEGVVAFSYDVRGVLGEPVVTVNTLSLFTPGIFRRIFEKQREYRPSTAELLEEAIAAKRENRTADYVATPEQLQELEDSMDFLGAWGGGSGEEVPENMQ